MSGLEDGLQKHQKVYSFLKRTLPQERYEGVRTIEPCVIVADGFNKAFKFAILGDEMLYITENPPRSSKDIRITVDLSTISTVEVIHDIAEFLGGDLKTKAQHILITYKKSASKTSNPSVSTLLPSDYSSSKLALQSSFLTASALVNIDSHEKHKSKSLTASLPPSGPVFNQFSSSNNLALQTGHMKLSASEGNILDCVEQERLQSSSVAALKKDMFLPICSRPLPPPPGMITAEQHLDHTSNYHDHSNSQSNSQHTRRRKRTRRKEQNESELNSSSSSNELDFSSFRKTSASKISETYNDHYDRYGRVPSPDGLARSPCERHHHRASSNESTGSGLGSSYESGGDPFESHPQETTELHMYILEGGTSPMFAFLKSTWNNCILKSTLRCSSSRTSSSSSARSFPKVDNSQLLTLFNQLKTEILQSHRMEKSFVLINELLIAAQKSFNLKKFFWKSPDLFHFTVNQIQHYLPHSPSSHSKRRGNNRADEFDYVVVLLETLACMFRETEILPSRLDVLKAHKAKAINYLLHHIITTPTVRCRPEESKISPAAQLLLSGSSGQLDHSKKEEETAKLMNEITDSATAMMYEVIAAVHQASYFAVEDNVINICWLVKIVDSHDHTETFVKRMMDRQMTIIQSDRKQLSPKNAVLLYHQLYILHNLLEYSDVIAASLPRFYAEEFRYYIKRPMLESKLPVKYPLTTPILSLLDKVTSTVLKTKSTSSFR